MNDLPAFVFVGLIYLDCRKSNLVFVKSRRVCGQDLETGSRLLFVICSPVKRKVSGLLSASAHNGFYLAGILIHDYERYLRLQGDCVILINNIACLCINVQSTLVFFDPLFRLFSGGEYERIIVIMGFTDICGEVFLTVVLDRSIGPVDRKSKFKSVFRCRIVAFVACHFVANFLNGHILCGSDCESSGIQKIVSLCLGISFLLTEITDHVFNQCVCEVGVRRCILGCGRSLLNPVVHRIGHCIIILSLIDISLIQHISQNFFTALSILVRIGYRIIESRILSNRRNDCAFGECQIRCRFVKVALGSCLDSQTALSEVDCIHVGFQYLVFVHLFFDLKGKILFLQLTLYFIKKCLLIDKVREYVIFNQLLRQGAGTLGKVETVGNSDDTGSDDTLEVDSVVFIKTFVLNRYKCMRKIFGVGRDLLICFIYTVGVGILQSFYYGSALIGNISCISLREYVVCRDGGGIVDDLFCEDRSPDDTYNSQKEYTNDKGFKEPYTYAFLFHSFF